MPKKIELTGKIFGELIVLREATPEEKQYKPGTYWICQCSCGNIKMYNGQSLREGKTKSCGCQTSKLLSIGHRGKTLIDITGKTYGRLTVIGRDLEEEQKHNSHDTYWKCKCSCGNELTVLKSSLIQGKTQSCGCLRKEIAAKHLQKISSNNFIDETGNKYGKLTVMYKVIDKNNNRNGILWHCICECGNEKDVMGDDLRQNRVRSCGCLGRSVGEWTIEKILSENSIFFSKEFHQNIQNKDLRFDFAIFNNQKQLKYLIEYDGQQHFNSIEHFGGEEYLKYTQEHDAIKNQWCKDNNIPLIRIPYTHLNELCLDDLKLETSKFILK